MTIHSGWIYTLRDLGKVRVIRTDRTHVSFVDRSDNCQVTTLCRFERAVLGEPEPPMQSVVVTARTRAKR